MAEQGTGLQPIARCRGSSVVTSSLEQRLAEDLDAAFPNGFELLLEGWRGPADPFPMTPLPTVTVAAELDGPWVPIDVEPRMIGPYLAYQRPGTPDFRYLRLAIDVATNPLAPAKVFVRPL